MKTILSSLFVALLGVVASAVPVTLAWGRNAEPDVTGYIVKTGTAPGVYDHTYNVADNAIQQTIDLPTGVFYYAVCIAVNSSGLESLPSDELCFQVYETGKGVAPKPPAGLRKTAIQVSLQSTTDPNLRIWATEGEFTFVTDAAQMFFRLQASR